MNLIDQHIGKHLLHFQNEEDISFQKIFELIQSDAKDSHSLLLQYIHVLLNEVFSKKKSDTETLHLHFEYDLDDDSILVVAQYILIRLFRENMNKGKIDNNDTTKLQELKKTLQSKKERLYGQCPEGAKGGSKIYKKWIKNKKDIQVLINFYDQLNENIEIVSNTVFNCQVQLAASLGNLFATKPYACHIENQNNHPTFNLLNTKLTLNRIDEENDSIIDNLKTVILFDCERKKMMQYFSLQDIIRYDNGIDLKKYMIITFGNKSTSIQRLKDKMNLIQTRFKIASKDSYSIIRSEIDYSLARKSKRYIPVLFIGIDTSYFWDIFMLETNIQDLYELRSIKMTNLYSLCFNREIKNFILQEIFSEKETSDLISDETKQRLLDLRNEDLLTLKDSLGNVLDLIISSNVDQIIINKIKSGTILIVDDLVLKSKKLSGLISSSLLLTEKHKLFSWSTFNTIENKATLILSYQDQGKYPYYFYPNIIETTVSRSVAAEAILHRFLFLNRYKWAKYNMLKDMYGIADHPVRKKYFQWERLKVSINSLRPQKSDDTDWNLEQQYSVVSERETIKLKLKNERERTFNNSELFIYSTNDLNFKVERIGDIIDAMDKDVKYFVHHLDEIQKNINLYEKMIDTKQQEEELNIIRHQFQIDNTETGRLWKILLKKKTLFFDEEELYNALKVHLECKGLKIVSLYHFKNNWLNPESDSMAPLNKKVFIELCEFLRLPKTYFILIQRLRNASKQSTRQSTLQMNRLLQNLFNDGCFDDGADLNKIIVTKLDNYIREHPLDELGIDERYLGDNLIALVELIKPEITLKEIEKFKKVE